MMFIPKLLKAFNYKHGVIISRREDNSHLIKDLALIYGNGYIGRVSKKDYKVEFEIKNLQMMTGSYVETGGNVFYISKNPGTGIYKGDVLKSSISLSIVLDYYAKILNESLS